MTKGIQEDENYSNFINMMTPMGHMGSVDDIASAATYLASDESKYVTGITLYVDGGYRAQ
jgi:enoyl-[acyl-carrier-protein] reductase (NADH)